mgnify:CR=1 FL=1
MLPVLKHHNHNLSIKATKEKPSKGQTYGSSTTNNKKTYKQ